MKGGRVEGISEREPQGGGEPLPPTLAKELASLAMRVNFPISPSLYKEARLADEKFVRKFLSLFGVRPPKDPLLASALGAYWAERYLKERSQEGGFLTAALLKAVEAKGGSWREGLRAWLRAKERAFGLQLPSLDAPAFQPLWVESPEDPAFALLTLTSWAKHKALHHKDRQLLYYLKDSLMVALWNEGKLRFTALLVRPKPPPPVGVLRNAFLAEWRGVEEAFCRGGYEALEELIPFWDGEEVPGDDEVLEAWGLEQAHSWVEAYRKMAREEGNTLPRAMGRLHPFFLLKSFGVPIEDGLSDLSWKVALERYGHYLDPQAHYVITGILKETDPPFAIHFPYRKARRFRIPLDDLPRKELEPEVRLGHKAKPPPIGDLWELVRSLGHPRERFPYALEPRFSRDGVETFKADEKLLR